MLEQELRTAAQVRPGDVVALFPGSPLLILSSLADVERPGWWHLLTVDPARDLAWHHVEAGTFYLMCERGPAGKAADRAASLVGAR